MNTTEQRKSETIRQLAAENGPCITIALGTTGDRGRQWTNAIRTVRQELQEREVNASKLLKPLLAAEKDVTTGRYAHEAVVLLRSPSMMEIQRVASVKPAVRVNDRFDFRSILSLVDSREQQFYILALSQKRSRILKCTQDHAEEIPWPADFPNSLLDDMGTRQPDHMLDNRASGGPSIGAGAVMFGTSSDQDSKDQYMLHFFGDIDKAVNVALKGSSDPLVPVGVESEIALYRRVNHYPHLVEPGVHGAPDGLEGGEMHRRALQLLSERADSPDAWVPADLDRRIGTGHASIRVQEIVDAAYQGRVSHLFFQPNSEYLGSYDSVRRRVKHTDDSLDAPVDLIEEAAYQTIAQGGEVRMLPSSAMPNGVPVCALFRYAEQTPAEPEKAQMAG